MQMIISKTRFKVFFACVCLLLGLLFWFTSSISWNANNIKNESSTNQVNGNSQSTEANSNGSFASPSSPDQENFFKPMLQNDTSQSTNRRRQLSTFVYNQSAYIIIEGNIWKSYVMIMIYRESTAVNAKYGTDDYNLVEQIQFNNTIKINKVVVFNVFSADPPGLNCYLGILVSQPTKKTSSIYYVKFDPNNSDFTGTPVIPTRIGDPTLNYCALAVAPGMNNQNVMNTLIVASPNNNPNNTTQRQLIFWNLVENTTTGKLQISETTTINCSLPNTQQFNQNSEITNIQRDNYTFGKDKTIANLLILTCSSSPTSNKSEVINFYFGIFSYPLTNSSAKIFSFSKLVNLFHSGSQSEDIYAIKIDFLDNIWFSVGSKTGASYLYLLDTVSANSIIINKSRGFFSIAAVIEDSQQIIPSSLKNLFSIQPIKAITNAYAFDVANIISFDYASTCQDFEAAKQEGQKISVCSTVYMLVRSTHNINNVLLEGDNLKKKLNLSSNADTSYLSLSDWTIIDNFQKINLFTSGLFIRVLQQQIFYSPSPVHDDENIKLGLDPINGLNNTAIFVWVKQYSILHNDDQMPIKFLTWRLSAIDDIFTADNNYTNWLKKNNAFHAEDIDHTGVGFPFFSADCELRNCSSYIQKWQQTSLRGTYSQNSARTNYFLASGPFAVCCDMSLNQQHQNVHFLHAASRNDVDHSDINYQFTIADAGSILNFSSGFSYQRKHYYSNRNNAMTRPNDNAKITINNYSQTAVDIGITAINFNLLNNRNFNFFYNVKTSFDNNISDDTLIRFKISDPNYIKKSEKYFRNPDSSAGFYYFLNQNSLNLNFNSLLFKNNSIDRSSTTSIAKLISINRIIKINKDLTFVLPDSDDNNVANVQIGNQWNLRHASSVNEKDNKFQLNSNVVLKDVNNHSKTNLHLGLFLLMITPQNVSTAVHSDVVFLLIQVGGLSVIYGNNINYVNLFNKRGNQFIAFVRAFGIILLAITILIYLLFWLLSKAPSFNILKQIGFKLSALPYLAGQASKHKKTRTKPTKGTTADDEKTLDQEHNQDFDDDIPTFSSFFDDE